MQVTIEHKFENGAVVPIRVHTIVISTQHSEAVDVKTLRKEIMEKVGFTSNLCTTVESGLFIAQGTEKMRRICRSDE